MRSALVAALVSCADSPHRSQARRFVQGLSSDELQFIAGFVGPWLLDSGGKRLACKSEYPYWRVIDPRRFAVARNGQVDLVGDLSGQVVESKRRDEADHTARNALGYGDQVRACKRWSIRKAV